MQAVGNPRQRSELIEKDSHLSIRRQCRLLHIHRSMIYYDLSEETVENLELMKKLDHLYLEDPSAGSRRMSSYLRRQTGKATNRKRVRRLMRKMGIEAIYPRKRTTIPGGPSGIYPYRLKGLSIKRPNQEECKFPNFLKWLTLPILASNNAKMYVPAGYQKETLTQLASDHGIVLIFLFLL